MVHNTAETLLMIFCLILRKVVTASMLFIGGEGPTFHLKFVGPNFLIQ